jgi:hypothetical protein
MRWRPDASLSGGLWIIGGFPSSRLPVCSDPMATADDGGPSSQWYADWLVLGQPLGSPPGRYSTEAEVTA